MTKLNKSTQRAMGFVWAYRQSIRLHGSRTIDQAYGRPSKEKESAWQACVDLCKANHGYGLTVVGGGTYQFSAAFVFAENGKEYLCYITKSNNYKIELAD